MCTVFKKIYSCYYRENSVNIISMKGALGTVDSSILHNKN